jgi:hypothetical protein
VIAANGSGTLSGHGLALLGSGGTATVRGNIIGLDASGTTRLNDTRSPASRSRTWRAT